MAPAERSVRLVSAAPRGEIKRYPIGHFDVYTGDAFEQAVSDQTQFLAAHLLQAARVKQDPTPQRL